MTDYRGALQWQRRKDQRRAAYRRDRWKLARDMAGGGRPRCAVCGRWLGRDWLEFDHQAPRTWNSRKVNRARRLCLYRRDWEAGRLRLACPPCNRKAGSPGPPRLGICPRCLFDSARPGEYCEVCSEILGEENHGNGGGAEGLVQDVG